MTKTVTATEAKNRLGALMSEVLKTDEAVIIELRGRPKVALISAERLERAEKLERRQRGEEAWKAFEELRARQGDRNKDLTDDQIMEMAVEAVRDVRRKRAESRHVATTGSDR
jgi:prevent-host-death family protein